MIPITNYKVNWNTNTHTGVIYLQLSDGSTPSHPINSPEELAMILQILNLPGKAFSNGIFEGHT